MFSKPRNKLARFYFVLANVLQTLTANLNHSYCSVVLLFTYSVSVLCLRRVWFDEAAADAVNSFSKAAYRPGVLFPL